MVGPILVRHAPSKVMHPCEVERSVKGDRANMDGVCGNSLELFGLDSLRNVNISVGNITGHCTDAFHYPSPNHVFHYKILEVSVIKITINTTLSATDV